MKSIKIRILNALLIVDIGIALFCILAGNKDWFINSQIGFFSSLAVVLASMYSYRKMIDQSVASGAVVSSNDELLEKIEDPHGVYDEDDTQETILEETIEEDKKITTLEALKKSKAFISFYRLGAYLLLALGFLYLQSNHILHIPSYLFGIMLPPVIIAVMFFWQSKNTKESL
ncbi:MAG: hypothetical protein JXQ77_03630 [Campylobacterales bacterium]|nr:hypothetical protein [Campylobacterales bacterium]